MQNNNLESSKKSMDKDQYTYAIANLSIVPLRALPQHKSELVSQVLFGEYIKVLATEENWSYIELEQDTYQGWIESSQLAPISSIEYERFVSNNTKAKVLDNNTTIELEGKNIDIVRGTTLPYYDNGFFEINNQQIRYSGKVISDKQNRNRLIDIANSYLNTPYLWGGKTSYGIDCSGFTQMVYHICGYSLQRDASLQAKQGELVVFLQQVSIGDLAFFDNEEGNITHVGIVLANNKIIHAAKGKVRIDSLDQEGIYNDELKKYTHHLRMLRSYF